MIKYHNLTSEEKIAELDDDKIIISQVQDILDIMADAGASGCNRIIIREKNLDKTFFDLKTGLAGEILQKFSNYHVKLAIIGDFSKFTSNSLHAFIRESNKGNMIFFTDTLDNAILKLK